MSNSVEIYKNIITALSRVMYNDLEIALLDCITYLYFNNFVFETFEISNHSKIPINTVRQLLFKFKDDMLIQELDIKSEDKNMKSYINNIIEKNYENKDRLEFWKIREDFKYYIKLRLENIRKKINKEFEEFDQYIKVCSNSFCKKEFKSEEYFANNNLCIVCGAELRLKLEVNEAEIRDKKDRENSIILITEILELIKKSEKTQFPKNINIKENNITTPNNVEKEEAGIIEEDDDFVVKFEKDFFVNNNFNYNTQELKNADKNIIAFIRGIIIEDYFINI